MYEEQPRYIGMLGRERTIGPLNFWASGAAGASFLLTLIIGETASWSLLGYLLFGLPFVAGCATLMLEYRGVLWIQRVLLLASFYLLAMTRFRLLIGRSLYTEDAPIEQMPELRLERVDADGLPLLGRALEEPV